MSKLQGRVFAALLVFFSCLYSVDDALALSNRLKLSIGSGISTQYAGRPIPSVHFGFDIKNFAMTFDASGVKSPIYYQNAYYIGIYHLFSPGDFLWDEIRGGFGGGLFHEMHGYKNDSGHAQSSRREYAAGPAIMIAWDFLGPIYVSVEGFYGLRGFGHILIEFQQMAIISAGLRI